MDEHKTEGQPTASGANQANGQAALPTIVDATEPVQTESEYPATAEKRPDTYRQQQSPIERFHYRFLEWWHHPTRERPMWTDISIVFLTIGIIFLGGMQFLEMRSGGKDTHDLAVAAGQQASAAKAQAEQAQAQTDRMGQTIAKTDALIQQAANQAIATNKLAVEAKRAADIANQSLQEIRANFARDQRPWVFVTAFTLSAEPEENKEITVEMTVANTGKGPALNVATQSTLLGGSAEPRMTIFHRLREIR